MQDALSFPDDLNACQRLLHELYDVLSSVQTGRDRLQQENEELQLLVKRLQRQLYGRRSERHVDSPGQGQLDFGDEIEVPDGQIISASEQQEEPTTTTTTVRRRRPRRPRSEALPEHLERRVERLEPTFPEGVSKDDCQSLGDDVVELLEFERGKLWVRRLEYAKYGPSHKNCNIGVGGI